MSLKGQLAQLRRVRTGARRDADWRCAMRIIWRDCGSLYGGEFPLDEIPEALVTARPREMEVSR